MAPYFSYQYLPIEHTTQKSKHCEFTSLTFLSNESLWGKKTLVTFSVLFSLKNVILKLWCFILWVLTYIAAVSS